MATKTSLPEAQGVYSIRDNQESSGDFVTPEEMMALTGGAKDESDLTDSNRERLNCQEDKAWLIWVSNPNDPRNRDRPNEVQQVIDKYRGSEVVIDPATGEEVRYEDMCLMKRPAKYKPVVEQLQKDEAKAFLANNPSTAGALGLSDAEIYELRHKFLDPEALRNRDEQFARGDKGRFQRIADQKRQSYQRALKAGSPTYKMPFERAYEVQLQRYAEENNLSRRAAEPEFRKHIDHLQAKARSGGRSDAGASEWKNDVARMMKQSTASTFAGFGNVGFGRESTQLRYSRQNDAKRRQSGGGSR